MSDVVLHVDGFDSIEILDTFAVIYGIDDTARRRAAIFDLVELPTISRSLTIIGQAVVRLPEHRIIRQFDPAPTTTWVEP